MKFKSSLHVDIVYDIGLICIGMILGTFIKYIFN
jgi:hypothetical protein